MTNAFLCGIRSCGLCCALFLIEKHHCRHSNDDQIADYAEPVRNLRKEEKAESCGKENLRVVIDGDFSCGRIAVSGSDAKLTVGRGKTCENEKQQLLLGHLRIGKQQIGECDDTGKGGEEKDDICFVFSNCAEPPHHRIRHASKQSVHQPDCRGKKVCV